MKSHPTLADVAEALLLFHAGGPWDEDRAARWFNLTNCVEATTRNLCELARRALLAMPEDLAATVRRAARGGT